MSEQDKILLKAVEDVTEEDIEQWFEEAVGEEEEKAEEKEKRKEKKLPEGITPKEWSRMTPEQQKAYQGLKTLPELPKVKLTRETAPEDFTDEQIELFNDNVENSEKIMWSMTRKYTVLLNEKEFLPSIANEKLLDAVRGFDPKEGKAKFTTYLFRTILNKAMQLNDELINLGKTSPLETPFAEGEEGEGLSVIDFVSDLSHLKMEHRIQYEDFMHTLKKVLNDPEQFTLTQAFIETKLANPSARGTKLWPTVLQTLKEEFGIEIGEQAAYKRWKNIIPKLEKELPEVAEWLAREGEAQVEVPKKLKFKEGQIVFALYGNLFRLGQITNIVVEEYTVQLRNPKDPSSPEKGPIVRGLSDYEIVDASEVETTFKLGDNVRVKPLKEYRTGKIVDIAISTVGNRESYTVVLQALSGEEISPELSDDSKKKKYRELYKRLVLEDLEVNDLELVSGEAQQVTPPIEVSKEVPAETKVEFPLIDKSKQVTYKKDERKGLVVTEVEKDKVYDIVLDDGTLIRNVKREEIEQ